MARICNCYSKDILLILRVYVCVCLCWLMRMAKQLNKNNNHTDYGENGRRRQTGWGMKSDIEFLVCFPNFTNRINSPPSWPNGGPFTTLYMLIVYNNGTASDPYIAIRAESQWQIVQCMCYAANAAREGQIEEESCININFPLWPVNLEEDVRCWM